jgi:hypothetical protein
MRDDIEYRQNSGQKRPRQYAGQESHRNLAESRRPASANELIAGYTRRTGEPIGQRGGNNDSDDDGDDIENDEDDDSRSESIEARLERVLNTVEDTGFDGIDSMTSTYYTSEFSDDSIIHPMQSASRTRHLRVLLAALQASYKSWSERARGAYTEQIIRAAEAICSDELQALYGSKSQRRRRVSMPSKLKIADAGGSVQSNRAEIANRFRELLSSPDVADFMQKDKVVLESLVCQKHGGFNVLCNA